MKGTPDRAVATGPGVVVGAGRRRVRVCLRGSGLRCRGDQVRGLSDRILRDLVLRSPVERRRTGDAVVLFYLAVRTDAKTGGRTIDDIWRAARPVTGDDATHAAIARGAFGVDDQATVQLVGACLRRLRNVPGGGRVPYPVPLVVAVDRFGVALPPSVGAGRGGYAGYAVRRVYRPVVARAEGGGRRRDPGDVQPFPEFRVPKGDWQETDLVWLSAVAHPATNAAFTAAGLPAKSRARRLLFEPWQQAMARILSGPGPLVDWHTASQALTVLLMTEDPDDHADMAARIDALRRTAMNVRDPTLDPDVQAAADNASLRLTRSVDDWRRRTGRHPADDDWPARTAEPPPF